MRTKYIIPITKTKITISPKLRPKQVVQSEKPEGLILKKGEWWCPYCVMGIKFKLNGFIGVKCCPRCGISERDFYVRKANNLWGDFNRKNKSKKFLKCHK